jgi:hypothetical protein
MAYNETNQDTLPLRDGDLPNEARTCEPRATPATQPRSVPVPESSIARRARELMECAAKLRGEVYVAPGKYLTPLQRDLARVDDCLHHTVYFIYSAGRIKIGYTTAHVRFREDSIANGSPVHVWLVKAVPGGKITEFRFHHRFKDARTHGEWFALTTELRAFIMEGNPLGLTLVDAETKYRVWLKSELNQLEET